MVIILEAVSFALAVFIGWVLFDYSKEKKWRKEKIVESFVAGVAGAVGWALLAVMF
ncbi:hypothetical protein [Salibacterium salarium]|uniref:hypothetical protein n=1 Tax=Salibacterium salarium TaxID=284579 RepID=UPI0016397352|nr:hypothetical protein [Salibacterium salarium]